MSNLIAAVWSKVHLRVLMTRRTRLGQNSLWKVMNGVMRHTGSVLLQVHRHQGKSYFVYTYSLFVQKSRDACGKSKSCERFLLENAARCFDAGSCEAYLDEEEAEVLHRLAEPLPAASECIFEQSTEQNHSTSKGPHRRWGPFYLAEFSPSLVFKKWNFSFSSYPAQQEIYRLEL
jgi:hypothetical protein